MVVPNEKGPVVDCTTGPIVFGFLFRFIGWRVTQRAAVSDAHLEVLLRRRRARVPARQHHLGPARQHHVAPRCRVIAILLWSGSHLHHDPDVT